MKKISIVYIIVACILFASCTTTQKFNVAGTAGTEIYTSSMERVGVIGSNGKAKVTLPADGYYAYLLAKKPQSNLLVPFALDYKKDSHIGAKAMSWGGFLLADIGFAVALTGGIDLACNGSDATMGSTFLGAGGGALLLGGTMYGVGQSRMNQTSYDYQFRYLSSQHANTDIQFTQPVFSEPYKSFEQQDDVVPSITPKATSSSVSSSTSKHRLSQKSSKTLRDYGKQTEGTYTGLGSLTKGGEAIEAYSNIAVKIVRISKDVVSVNVVESDGSEFFETPTRYKVTKLKNGTFLLTNSEIHSATITIDKNGKLTYVHPKVNIDGDIYSLKINAK